MRNSTLSASDVDAAPLLRAIGKQGVGIDRVNAEACKRRSIVVLNTPGIHATAVAELLLALTMSVARQIGDCSWRDRTMLPPTGAGVVSKCM